MRPPITVDDEKCGLLCWKPRSIQRLADIRLFTFIMCLVIAVQGTYLGYAVGVLTNIEKRFEISSSMSGTLLSMYDIGHTTTVLFVGHFLAQRHKPRCTGVGVLLSGLAMFMLALPNFLFGPTSFDRQFIDGQEEYINSSTCNPDRTLAEQEDSLHDQGCKRFMHNGAYVILALSQLLAGIAAAPFNTLAYIYVDDNVNTRQSPFYLGLLTSMYAFGPAFGFALSAGCTSFYVDLTEPLDLDQNSPSWIGAWWLGFVIIGTLYFVFGVTLFFFPYRIPKQKRAIDAMEMTALDRQYHQDSVSADETAENVSIPDSACKSVLDMAKELPIDLLRLLKNPVYTSMVLGWIFGSYLVGGYGTYLPKYIETQYSQTASMANVYAGLITIGSVAVSTALGGYLLTRFNIQSRLAILLLIICWIFIMITYLLGMMSGCDQPSLHGTHIELGNCRLARFTDRHLFRWNFTTECSAECKCGGVKQFDPVCDGNWTYFSPCFAGCSYDKASKNVNLVFTSISECCPIFDVNFVVVANRR
ncbi:unnamed protein product [Soboliphyme baturini]|uniref:Solute carrier organic anion transporter family member n=1 Tax=Soboliphyme baturini TaxID=241478 RepID=A0A183IWE0_9BILA|nr:unnamed protein product [Soboliphyme baturini]